MPLFAALEHIPIRQRQFEWNVDDIPFTSTLANIEVETRIEGEDSNFVMQDKRDRLHSFAQINSRSVDVTDTSRIVDTAGIDDEFLYQIERHLLIMGRDMEMAAHWGRMDDVDLVTSDQGDAGIVAKRQTSGVCDWVISTGSERAQAASVAYVFPSSAGGGINPGASVGTEFQANLHSVTLDGKYALTKTIVNDNILAPAWRTGMQVQGCIGFSGHLIKTKMSTFALDTNGSINERRISAAAKTLIDTIDVFEFETGMVYMNLDRYMDIAETFTIVNGDIGGGAVDLTFDLDEALMFIDPRFFQIGMLRGVGFKQLATVGDSTKGMLVGEWGIRCQNPIAGTAAVGITS